MLKKIDAFERGMECFHVALLNRLRRIVQTDGSHPEVDLDETTYVIPGYTYDLKDENQHNFKLWVGANYQRLFFIARLKTTVEEAKKTFHFTFGGAESVGWTINYEPIGDEVSIWATKMVTSPLITPAESSTEQKVVAEITDTGSFWAVDIAMMVQSLVRTAQREGIKPSLIYPAPL